MNNKIGPSQAYGTLQDLCSKHDLDDRLITKLICMSAQDKRSTKFMDWTKLAEFCDNEKDFNFVRAKRETLTIKSSNVS